MSHSHQTTNLHNAYVYHKLTEKQGKAWCLPDPFGANVRRQMASQLAKMYPQNGCGVCSATMKLVAYVSPRAELRLLVAPFKKIPIHLIANKPALKDCPCFEFIDTEIRGPWKSRPLSERERFGGHHPMCQYQRTAQQVFDALFQAKNGGLQLDEKMEKATRGQRRVEVRPDLMLVVQRKLLDR